jgi:hypothetical protein
MTKEEQNLVYTDYDAYITKLKDIADKTAAVIPTIENTV